jgi:hypothetical protein
MGAHDIQGFKYRRQRIDVVVVFAGNDPDDVITVFGAILAVHFRLDSCLKTHNLFAPRRF